MASMLEVEAVCFNVQHVDFVAVKQSEYISTNPILTQIQTPIMIALENKLFILKSYLHKIVTETELFSVMFYCN